MQTLTLYGVQNRNEKVSLGVVIVNENINECDAALNQLTSKTKNYEKKTMQDVHQVRSL